MKTLSILNTLPLAGILAMSLSLAPAVTLADDDRGRGRDHVYKKHDGGKHHYREHRRASRDHGAHKRGYHKGHKHGHKHHSHKHHGHKHHRHGHSHRGHSHRDHGHRHVDRVIVHNYYDDWNDYDRFRLMLGLHFDNVDLIYRDY